MARYNGWKPYVPVRKRRRQAAREAASAKERGIIYAPVHIDGRKITKTFWGQAWCDNLESYSDYASRLPRGRRYVRNGSVIDLQIESGKVTARVAGSSIYRVSVAITAVTSSQWKALCSACAGEFDSVMELLSGRFSSAVMHKIAKGGQGVFPTPQDISLSCSCPDWAAMCKHVAAALYGVGARLDQTPELLFKLRQVDPLDLVAHAEDATQLDPLVETSASSAIAAGDLSAIFGIDIDIEPAPGPSAGAKKASAKKASAKKAGAQKAGAKKAGARKRAGAKKTTATRADKAATSSRRTSRPRASGTASSSRTSFTVSAIRAGLRVSRAELLALGVPVTTFNNWFRDGHLSRTGTRGVYKATRTTRERIAAVLAARILDECWRARK